MYWIKEKWVKQDRQAYILRIDDQLGALLIYHPEEPKDHELKGIQENAIKICTLKVGDGALGMKLGELFLNKMFQLCDSKKVNYLYVTTYEKQKALIHILTKFGFEQFHSFVNSIGEEEYIFLKRLKPKD